MVNDMILPQTMVEEIQNVILRTESLTGCLIPSCTEGSMKRMLSH